MLPAQVRAARLHHCGAAGRAEQVCHPRVRRLPLRDGSAALPCMLMLQSPRLAGSGPPLGLVLHSHNPVRYSSADMMFDFAGTRSHLAFKGHLADLKKAWAQRRYLIARLGRDPPSDNTCSKIDAKFFFLAGAKQFP